MEYLDWFINIVWDMMEDFMDNFIVVSGKTLIRVFIFSAGYFIGSLFASVLKYKFMFVDWKSALIAVIITGTLCFVCLGKKEDIEKFKNFLKGEE